MSAVRKGDASPGFVFHGRYGSGGVVFAAARHVGFPSAPHPVQAPWNRTSPSSGWSNLNDVIADIVEMTHPRWKDEAEKNGVREETIVRPRAERERAFEPFFTTKGGEAGWGSAWSTQS